MDLSVPGSRLYSDGSSRICTRCRLPAAKRAGWALVHTDADGFLLSAAYGPCPADMCPDQSSQEAEDFCFHMLAKVTNAASLVHVDNAATVATANGPLADACGPKAVRAHRWRALQAARLAVVAAKVKAHTTQADMDSGTILGRFPRQWQSGLLR